jgi:allophanate hydrolase
MDPGPSSSHRSGVHLAVVGAHLSGQPLNSQLTDRGATLVRTTATAARYRLLALPTDPPKPGLVRVPEGDPAGAAIEVEVWSLAPVAFAGFVDAVPAPLCIGRVRLADGTDVAGFLCEPVAAADPGALDITGHRGWRAYLASPGDRRGRSGRPPRPGR